MCEKLADRTADHTQQAWGRGVEGGEVATSEKTNSSKRLLGPTTVMWSGEEGMP
jgi:hypothetical protein